jgi:hypothetical protein
VNRECESQSTNGEEPEDRAGHDLNRSMAAEPPYVVT